MKKKKNNNLDEDNSVICFSRVVEGLNFIFLLLFFFMLTLCTVAMLILAIISLGSE